MFFVVSKEIPIVYSADRGRAEKNDTKLFEIDLSIKLNNHFLTEMGYCSFRIFQHVTSRAVRSGKHTIDQYYCEPGFTSNSISRSGTGLFQSELEL